MLNHIERELRNSGKDGLAQIVSGVHAILGKDIPFSVSEQTLSLEDATREYKNKPTNSERLTQFMRVFWQEAGQRIGKNIIVDKFPLTAKEIKEKQGKGYMAIFVPEGINRVDLGKMFSKMESWVVQKGNSVEDVVNNSGWLWVEASVDSPNRNTTQRQLEEKFNKERKQGQSLRTYIIGGQISKLLTGKYFDEEVTWSRLWGSCDGGLVLGAYFISSGDLLIDQDLHPEGSLKSIGGRSEEVIKA